MSECCGAEPKWSVEDGIGICSECGEWADFEEEEE
jgi:predicted ATP-dependent serine protease|tara:strand:+ start:167 stop:271 length:105 start_codon:yes stop_codon:yes gene_type:complete